MLYVYIRNFFFTVYFFLVCHQTDISLKSGIYKLTLDYFGHERSENHWSMLKIYIHASNIFWSTFEITFSAYFQNFSEKTGKKCLPTIKKRGLISQFIFNLVPFTPISKTIEHSFLKMGANLKYLLRLNHLYRNNQLWKSGFFLID